ncbi:MAG: hypothetical protein R2849_15715 [Thermomicrobiales bacterium]
MAALLRVVGGVGVFAFLPEPDAATVTESTAVDVSAVSNPPTS